MALVVPSGILVAWNQVGVADTPPANSLLGRNPRQENRRVYGTLRSWNLFSRDSHCLAGIAEVAHCSAGTGAGLEWNPDVTHREFDTVSCALVRDYK